MRLSGWLKLLRGYRRHGVVIVLAFLLGSLASAASPWLLPSRSQPYWGHRDGLVFTIWPGTLSHAGDGGPRGLIRVGFMNQGKPQMLNFIGVEPIVKKVRCLSELEPSELDWLNGKRFWCFRTGGAPDLTPAAPRPRPEASVVQKFADGHEVLEVGIGVEPFINGAKTYLIARMDSRQPEELTLEVQAAPGSATMERCILTATMGNFIRARQLWLTDRVAESTQLYPDYRQTGFAPARYFERDLLLRKGGDLWAAITTDEPDPAAVLPFAPDENWHYAGPPVTQYWRVRDDYPAEPCQVSVNGRYTYWKSNRPVPGGIAFENFEIDRPFHPGQTFTFGLSKRTPAMLGFSAKPSKRS